MIKRRKKGFTLVEMLVALTIFSLGATSIFVIVNSSSNTYRQDNVRFETMSAADTLIQQLKSVGTGPADGNINPITTLSDLFDSNIANPSENYYMYFNYSDLRNAIALDKSKYVTIPSGNVASYTDCYNKDMLNKDYGAFIKIVRAQGSQYDGNGNLNTDWYYNNYVIDVSVWNMKEGEYSLSHVSVNISR